MHLTFRQKFISLTAGFLFVILSIAARAESPAIIDDVIISSDGTHTQVRLITQGAQDLPHIFTLGDGKPRVVIDFSQCKMKAGLKPNPKGAIQSVRHAVHKNGTRIVLDLVSAGKLVSKETQSGQVLLTLSPGQVSTSGKVESHNQTRSVPPVSKAYNLPRKSDAGLPIPRIKPANDSKAIWAAAPQNPASKKRLIVIDAGHGGHDPGAIGISGAYEKNITLAHALELKKILVKSGRYNVLLVRGSDVFVGLKERVRKARDAKDADLFISLHADSLGNTKTRGASVYTLAPEAKNRSSKMVDSQNWIQNVDLSEQTDTVGSILVSLAQKKTASNSHRFAQVLIPEIRKVAPLLKNTHRRRGLAVLLAPDVPAVLLEMGYMSNPEDERSLKSARERKRKMNAVKKAIDKYFST